MIMAKALLGISIIVFIILFYIISKDDDNDFI